MLPNTLPQVNFGHLTKTALPTQFRVGILSHCDTLPISFCHFKLDGAGKGKTVTENLEKLLRLLHTFHTSSGSFGENKGVFPIGKNHEKKGGKFEISGGFLARDLDQIRSAC